MDFTLRKRWIDSRINFLHRTPEAMTDEMTDEGRNESDSSATCSALGDIQILGFDGEGYERRRRYAAETECSKCGKSVELWEETTEWVQENDGRWHHENYDECATGFCCGDLYADWWDGTFRFEPSQPNRELNQPPS